jgi:hypothetical protein
MTNGTAVARQDVQQPPTDAEIEQIRKRGTALVAHRKEIAKLDAQISGLTWGSGSQTVQGASFSPMTRAVLAEFCAITRANPLYHVDILGGRPYLNSNYWSDLINTRPDFHHFEQRDLSPSVEQAMRGRAAKHRELAASLEGPEQAQRIAKALDLEEDADDLSLARAQWSAPEWATVVIQTTIWKFIDAAPLEAIRSGEITDIDRYLVAVPECNWAGNKPPAKKKDGGTYEADPIGNAEPAKTARTRSLRRAAVKSFSAWMQQYDRQIAKAEQAIEAEYTVIREDRAEQRQIVAGQAVQSGGGEPQAAASNGAKSLPTEDATTTPAAPPFDASDARKAYFATLRDAGIEKDSARKKWQVDQGLGESTKQWGAVEYGQAMDALLEPARQKALEGADVLGEDAEAMAQQLFGSPLRDLNLKQLKELAAGISARVDGAEAEASGQRRLV